MARSKCIFPFALIKFLAKFLKGKEFLINNELKIGMINYVIIIISHASIARKYLHLVILMILVYSSMYRFLVET